MALRKTLILTATLAVTANSGLAQSSGEPQPLPTEITRELCLKPENAERPECTALLENAQNFVPLIGGAAGLLALGALAGGGGGSTTSTTGTR
ncbi:hypothetical protein AVO45_15970 [Ruegeria marisrubri]|uniref:Uncharacterized protein n=1 Tax=Ruegeria marisrubri TaxID=1685379 RepID=A0A0X3TC84_9RHOB|nr:hypothetical protein [Ruegeria marisrubri]KUJ73229.1 hypothetical protein AVO45_15970 [Ruegeria marisrubri]